MYAVLEDELTDDPLGRGYSGMTNAQVAADLNTVYRTTPVDSVSGQQIFEAVVPADFAELTDAEKLLLYAIIGMGTILVNGTNTKAALVAMFAGKTETLANLAALQTRPVTRATELKLRHIDVGNVACVRG